MHRVVLAVLAALAVQSAWAAGAAAQLPPDSALHHFVRARVESGRSAGIVVGVRDADGREHFTAFNHHAHGEGTFDEHTIFEIGSITKAFTGALLAEMAGRGHVALDDPVAALLPAGVVVPSSGERRITLTDLATHSSALPRIPANMRPASFLNPYVDYSVEQLYEFLGSHELRRGVGEAYEYSNLGFGLLGHALALRAGATYEDLLRERILGPLGMDDTGITLSDDRRARLAPGHNARGDTVPNWDLPTLAGAGALRSTAADMLRFLAAHLRGDDGIGARIVTATQARRAAGSANMDIGLGWHILRRPDRTLVWHNGGTGGYRTFAGFDAGRGIAVVVLTNSAVSADDIGFHLLDPSMPLAEP